MTVHKAIRNGLDLFKFLKIKTANMKRVMTPRNLLS